MRPLRISASSTNPQDSDGIVNLSGERKLEGIRARFGDDFAYLGNDHVDLPIWRASKASLVVGSRSLGDKATAVAPLKAEFPRSRRPATRLA
jgi:hypothetical protein